MKPLGPPGDLGPCRARPERSGLRIGAADLLRLRWKPFHSYMEQRLLEFKHFRAPRHEAASEKT